MTRYLLIVTGVLVVGFTVTSCFHYTTLRFEREEAFCTSKGMGYEVRPNSQLNVCIDKEGFAHPISSRIGIEDE